MRFSKKTGDRGQVLVIVALVFVVLLGFAALAVDVGYMYTVRHELQRCADAGALAGASAFISGVWSSATARTAANNLAMSYASRDAVGASPLDITTDVDVSFPSLDRVRVGTHRTVNLFFARIFGVSNTTINAYAVAEAAAAGPGTKILRLVE
jgi:Flp pilus assembly protein TadG